MSQELLINNAEVTESQGEIIIYQTDDGNTKIDVKRQILGYEAELITNTEMPLASAYAKSFPRSSQTRRVTSEMLITTGTNTPETLSATFAIGAFVAAASLTILII